MKIISGSEGLAQVLACFVALVQGAGFPGVGGIVLGGALVIA